MSGEGYEKYRREDDPSGDDAAFGWSIVRALPGTPTKLCVVSTSWFGIRTHYWKGRTTPCLVAGCEACLGKQLSRWHGYLQCVRPGTTEKVLLEFTPACHEACRLAKETAGGLRGMNIVVSRTANKANAKVRIVFQSVSQSVSRLPGEEDFWAILSHIWGLNRDAKPESDRTSNPIFSEFDRFNGATVGRPSRCDDSNDVVAA